MKTIQFDAKLHHTVRPQFEAELKPPFSVARLFDQEIARRLGVLRETPTDLTLLVEGRAVAELSVVDGQATTLTIREGRDALALIDQYGFQVSTTDAELVARALEVGANPTSALASLVLSKTLYPLPVPAHHPNLVRFGNSPHAVLEIALDRGGKTSSHRWLCGLEGWRMNRRSLHAKSWPAASGPVRDALDKTQAALFVLAQKGVFIDEEASGNGWLALARTPRGVERFDFTFAQSDAAKMLLDPAQLTKFAQLEIERLKRLRTANGGHSSSDVQQLRFAAAAIHTACAMIPAGENTIPACFTKGQSSYAFERSYLDQLGAKLRALSWFGDPLLDDEID